jgi:hypothetical protein
MDSLNHETDSIPMQDAKLDTYNTATPDMWWVNAATSSGYVFSASEFSPLASTAGTDLSDAWIHYKLNDTNANNTVADAQGNDAGAFYDYTATQDTDDYSAAGKINRTDFLPDAAIQGSNFTVCFWVKFEDGQPAVESVFAGCQDNSSGDDRYGIHITAAGGMKLQLKIGSDDHTVSPTFMPNGATDWEHIAVVKHHASATSGYVLIYTNASVAISTDMTFTWASYSANRKLYIGTSNFRSIGALDPASYPTYYPGAYIDDWRIFPTKALTESELSDIVNSGTGTESSSPGAVTGTDMYVQSSNQLYSTSADESYSWVYMAGNDTNVVTNIQYRTSLDGGATWLANILEPSGFVTGGTFTNSVFFSETNFPSSGTNLMYEFNSINDDSGGVVRDVAIGRK